MNRSVAIICPDYPPRAGGVSDHTALLLETLADHLPVQLITSEGTHTPSPPVTVHRMTDWKDEEALFATVNALPAETVLLWQYVPHMYGRGGVAPAVPRVMRRLQIAGRRRQIVLAHEIAAPWSWQPQRALYAWSHRRQWREIVSSADAVVTSTEAWRDEWKRNMPEQRLKFSYAASPSTIPVAPVASAGELRIHWRRQYGWSEDTLVLGWFGTASAAKQVDWVFAAHKHSQSAGRPVAVMLIGNADDLAQAQNTPLIQSTGYVDAATVSHALQSIDLLLLPFIDGVSERRTSFMAGLAHGTPIATTWGPNTGQTLRSSHVCALTISNDPTDFVDQVQELLLEPERRITIGACGRAYYQQHYDWPVVAKHLLDLIAQEASRA